MTKRNLSRFQREAELNTEFLCQYTFNHHYHFGGEAITLERLFGMQSILFIAL